MPGPRRNLAWCSRPAPRSGRVRSSGPAGPTAGT